MTAETTDKFKLTVAQQLARPFTFEQLSYRVGSMTKDKKKGMMLTYIDARDVEKRLDDVVGMFGWQNTHVMQAGGNKVECSIGIRVHSLSEDWIWKSNGAGDTAIEGDKGSFTDAFKRAAVMWGIGRYLYSMPNEWADLDQYKKPPKNWAPSKFPVWASQAGYDELMENRWAQSMLDEGFLEETK